MSSNSHRFFLPIPVLILSILIGLSGCRINSGHGPRSTMSDEDASAACLKEVSQLIRNSDADGLVAAFSEKAKSDDPELSAKAEKVMSLMGGGTMSEQGFGSSQKIFPNVSTHVLSLAVITAPDGTKWQIHIIDCTYNKEDPSKVGLKSIEIIPYSDWDAPKGFSWYAPDDQWPYGIRLIMNWNDWDPATNSKLPSVPS